MKTKFKLVVQSDIGIAHAFRCPKCNFPAQPANVALIVCQNCGQSGTAKTFSCFERKAA